MKKMMETVLPEPLEIGVRVNPINNLDCAPPNIYGNIVFVEDRKFSFNHTLLSDADQRSAYRTLVKPRLDHLLKGSDITIIVYGKTQTGKTYTIFGPEFNCMLSETEFGILPRTIRKLFKELADRRANGNFKFQIRLSFVEYIGGLMRDLLSPHCYERFLTMDDLTYNKKHQLVISEATEVICKDTSCAINLIQIGMKKRLKSSKPAVDLSHCLCTIHVDQEWQELGNVVSKSSRVVFVDLSSKTHRVDVVYAEDPPKCGCIDFTAESALTTVTSSMTPGGAPDGWPQNVQSPVFYEILSDLLFGSMQTTLLYCTQQTYDTATMIENFELAERVRRVSYKLFIPQMGMPLKGRMLVNANKKLKSNVITWESLVTPGNDLINQASVHQDISRLDVAAEQCAALLASAENIFQRLLYNGHAEYEQYQIQKWLQFREQCKGNFIGLCNTVMSSNLFNLERIDEETETSSCEQNINECNKGMTNVKVTCMSCKNGATNNVKVVSEAVASQNGTYCRSCIGLNRPFKPWEGENVVLSVTENQQSEQSVPSKIHFSNEQEKEEDHEECNGDVDCSDNDDEDSNNDGTENDFGEYEESYDGVKSERSDDNLNDVSDLNEDGQDDDDDDDDDEDDDDGDDDDNDDDEEEDDDNDYDEEEEKEEEKLAEEEEEEEEDDDDDYDDEVQKHTEKPDFVEKLDSMIKRLKHNVDKAIGDGGIDGEDLQDDPVDESSAFQQVLVLKNGRRKSIFPVENDQHLRDMNCNEYADGAEMLLEKQEDGDICVTQERVSLHGEDETESKLNSRNEIVPYDEIRLLSSGHDAKQSQIGLVNFDLEGATKQIEELKHTIQIKEQFIEEMIHNSEARTNARARFQKKHCRIEEEYFKARSQLAKAEKALNDGNNITLQKEIEKYKALAKYYEKRLYDIEMIKQMPGDSSKKILELQSSLYTSKRKMLRLKTKLKREEEYKSSLERELKEDQKRIKELEQKCQSSRVTGKEEEQASESERLKWIAEEEMRLMNLQESSQRLQDQLYEQQMILDKRELFLKEKLSNEKSTAKSLMDVSARISHLEQVLKEKSTNLEQVSDAEVKEALRLEINNLRKTRDVLVEQRCNLDAKLNKDKMLTTVEERKFLECDEAIEAIDATIEYKNELLCGRRDLNSESNSSGEQGEIMLMARLMKLSPSELKTLLCKYFKKVVDLRESGRKMEAQIADLDQQTEAQSWKIHALTNALQQAHLESERRLVVAQRKHQEKLHLMFRHFAEETSGQSSSGPSEDKWRTQNKALKQRIVEMEALLYNAKGSSSQHKPSPANALNIPQQNLKQLQGSSAAHTTKVTRQRNKLIIQQSKTKKPSK